MNAKNKRSTPLSEEAIDRLVVAQADDDSAWEAPVHVSRPGPVSVELPTELASRAAFFARLHRAPSVAAWVRRIIEERTEVEEAAYASIKRELSARAAS